LLDLIGPSVGTNQTCGSTLFEPAPALEKV
jgi:hypothetical protein